jgi:mycofactocin precursor
MADSATELLDPPADEITSGDSGQPIEGNPGVASEDIIAADLLVQEISIDGMCGVY